MFGLGTGLNLDTVAGLSIVTVIIKTNGRRIACSEHVYLMEVFISVVREWPTCIVDVWLAQASLIRDLSSDRRLTLS